MSGASDLARAQLTEELRAEFEHSLSERVRRYLKVQHQNIVAGHHFAAASTECLQLYRDGYFLSTVMVSQSVAEGVFRFVLERNGLVPDRELPEMAELLVGNQVLSSECAAAFVRIWQSFRNDVHHMNPRVAQVPFERLAADNIEDLAVIEREVFAYRVANGRLSPVQPKYWDAQPDGTVPAWLRIHA